jgi:quinol monooxygenase YgiN
VNVVVVATIVPKPEERAAVIAAFEAAVPAVHAEPGCELYAMHEGRDQLVMIEKWASEEDLERHAAGAVLAALGPALKDKLAASNDVRTLRPHPAGDAEKGTL